MEYILHIYSLNFTNISLKFITNSQKIRNFVTESQFHEMSNLPNCD